MTGACQTVKLSFPVNYSMGEESSRIITQEINYGFIELCYILKNNYPEMEMIY
jgi:hypothetical protein